MQVLDLLTISAMAKGLICGFQCVLKISPTFECPAAGTNSVTSSPFFFHMARPCSASRGRINADYGLSLKEFQGLKANTQETANTVRKAIRRVGHQNFN